MGRIFWDFLREKYWTDQVAHKIQKKLSKIKVRAIYLPLAALTLFALLLTCTFIFIVVSVITLPGNSE